jgi:hypothetical protein
MNGTAKRNGWTALRSAIGSAGLALVIVSASAGAARAEGTEAPAVAPAAPAGAPPTTLAQADVPPPAPPPAPPVVVAPAPAAPPPPPPPTATEAMPASRPEKLPPIQVGAWTRVGSVFQGGNPSKVNDWRMDNAYVELHAGGKIHEKVGVTLNLNGNMLVFGDPTATTAAGQIGSTVAIMDAIISFDPIEEFHLWAGRLLVPVDRSNASGPFFMIPWNYPGFLTVGATTIVTAPKEGPSGRNNGAVAWGDIKGGRLTYLAGVFDNANPATSPLYSGRVRLALWDKEPGFWGNGSYFGEKNLLSIGLGGQYQKHGSASMTLGDKDWAEVNADVLFEMKLPGGSWLTIEEAVYINNVHSGGVSASGYTLAAYATPTLGVGNIQPMVRHQWARLKDNMGTNPWNIDAGIAYLVKGPALRLLATYSHTTLPSGGGTITANSIQLGAQAIFF